MLPIVILSGLVLISCENEDISQEGENLLEQKQTMAVQQANPSPNFTEGEKELHNKVMNLAANRMEEDFHNMIDQQLPLDHNGQRMGVYNLTGYTIPWYLSPNGFYATTEHSIDCYPNEQADIITPTSYEKLLVDNTVSPPVELLKISYIRFGNALATINYE